MTAAALEIRPLRGRGALHDWLRVPGLVYAREPHFIEPLRMVERDRISARHNPFFTYGEAEMFLAYSNGRPVGRISAQINRNHIDRHGDATGQFGFFDCEENGDAARLLVGAAERWLRARGMTRMCGPFNLSINQDSGLLVSGFDTPPSILTSHAAPWSGQLLEGCGLSKAIDLHAFRMAPGSQPREIDRLARLARNSGRVRVRQIRMDRFADEVRLVFDIFNDAWSDNWGYVPVTEPDIAATIRDMRPIMRAKFGWIVEIDGEPAAMMVVLPDLNRVVKPFGGRLLPFNWARLAYAIYADRWETARVPLLGIRRRYRDSVLAPAALSLMVSEFISLGKGYDLEWVEFSWILETNRAMINIATLAAGPPVRTYRVYEKMLSSSAAT